MIMYYVLKHDKDSVYLRDSDGHLVKLERALFDFKIKAGDRIELYQDADMTVVVPFVEEKVLEINGEKSVKSSLLQGILDLFLETLAIHNNQLGNLKQVFSQFLITLFMAWSLLGVIVIEILLFLESALVFLWKLLIRGLKPFICWITVSVSLKSVGKLKKNKHKLNSLNFSSKNKTITSIQKKQKVNETSHSLF